jgi:hypothetical protein
MQIELDELLGLTNQDYLAAHLLYALWNKQATWQDKIPRTPNGVEIAVSCHYSLKDLWEMTGRQDDLIPLYEALKQLGNNGYVGWFPTNSPEIHKFHVFMPDVEAALMKIRASDRSRWQKRLLERCWPALAGLRSR